MIRTPRTALVAGVCLEKSAGDALSPKVAPESRFAAFREFAILPAAAAQLPLDLSKFDPVEHYGTRFLAGLIAAGVLILLYSLLRYRGKTAGPVSWGILVLGAGIMPIFVSTAGGVLVFEKSQRVGMCNSCHLTMKPYVDDMKDPQSQSLAALHYKNRYIEDNQCYSCHTSYGMFGTVQAKKEGLIDVYKYYTHTFKTPITMRHPYSNNDCLKCHGGSAKFLASHKKDRDAMFADEVSCGQCHDDDNPAHNLQASVKK